MTERSSRDGFIDSGSELREQCSAFVSIDATIVVIHFKSADLISGLLDTKDVMTLLLSIDSIIMETFRSYGCQKLVSISGVYIGAVVSPVQSKYDILAMTQSFRARVDNLSKAYQIHISGGVSVQHRKDFFRWMDNIGTVHALMQKVENRLDLAISMACYNEEGLYVSKDFDKALRQVIPSHELVRKQYVYAKYPPNSIARRLQTVRPETGMDNVYWLRVRTTSQGIQLEDFTYYRMLGKGGYGSVHLVREKHSNKEYAIKVILPRKGMPQMIKRECMILQTMQHPNVVAMKYAFMSNSRLYLVMDYIAGANLKQITDSTREKDIPQVVFQRWFAQLIVALEYIHEKGIIHRDVKPANCMIGKLFANCSVCRTL
jgi:hypothetical protein